MCFFALFFENGILGLKICTFLPSDNILKVVQKSVIEIFVKK